MFNKKLRLELIAYRGSNEWAEVARLYGDERCGRLLLESDCWRALFGLGGAQSSQAEPAAQSPDNQNSHALEPRGQELKFLD